MDPLGRPIYGKGLSHPPHSASAIAHTRLTLFRSQSGDAFGAGFVETNDATPYDLVLKKNQPWGALEDNGESESEGESEEEEEEEEEEESEPETEAEAEQPATGAEPLDLRKRGGEDEDSAAPTLYKVLDIKEASVGEGSLMGSAHTYVVPGGGGGMGGDVVGAAPGDVRRRKKPEPGATEITLNPEDLETGMDDAAVAARFEQSTAVQRAAMAPEDFSDMVADNARRTKRKAAEKKKESDAKKFKF